MVDALLSKKKREEFLRMKFLTLSNRASGNKVALGLYAAALKASSFVFQLNPQVMEIYVRKKRGDLSLQPGLSDIDLTVVLSDKATNQSQNLQTLWRVYFKLKRFFPMLGEIEFLTQSAFADVQTLGPVMGSAIKHFELVYSNRKKGKSSGDRYPFSMEEGYYLRVLNREIVWRYLRYVLPETIKYIGDNSPFHLSWVLHNQKQMFLRLKAKGFSFSQNSDPLENFTLLFNSLNQEPATYANKGRYLSVSKGRPITPPNAVINFTNHFLSRVSTQNKKRMAAVVWNAFGVKDQYLMAVILPNDLKKEDLIEILKNFHEVFQFESTPLKKVLADFPMQMPALISSTGFRAWMNTQPFENYEYSCRGYVLHGEPPESVSIPLENCTDYITNEYLSLLSLHNHRRSGTRATFELYTQLIDQMHIYLSCFKNTPFTLSYKKQLSPPNTDLADLHAEFGDCLKEMRKSIFKNLN